MHKFILTTGILLGTIAYGTDEPDPFLWLEDVEGEKAIEWVKARNRESLDVLENDPRFERIMTEAETILQAADRIPYIRQHGDRLYNFWRDREHVRGIWRSTTLEEYQKQEWG